MNCGFVFAAPSLLGEMPVWIHRDRVNSEFDETLCLLEPGSKLNLVDVIIVDGGLLPRFLILEPDYLVDASALAESVCRNMDRVGNVIFGIVYVPRR